MTRNLARFALAIAALFALLNEAKAIQITINSISKNAGETANYSQNNSTNAGEWQSATSILSAGGSAPDVINNTVSGSTRYASVLGSDSNAANFGARGDSATTNYQVTFTVTPTNPLSTYSLQIDTRRLGALVNRDEGSASGSETISGVTGTLSSPVTGTLNLPALATQSSNATVVTNINQSASAFVTGPLSGVQVFTLNFTWTQSTNSGNNVLNGGDEAVVLLGLPGTAALFGASDDYPGTSGRTQANDGHFVTVTATVLSVPEPSTLVMAAMGVVGLGSVIVRRRRRS
jgi:hypothetical protein